MELRHLRYFVAIAELEHFRRAAEKLRIAQPALTRQIKSLEAELGVQLFDRSSRGVSLSPAGRAFLDDARQILEMTNEAAARARRTALGQAQRLSISFTEPSSSHGVVPEAIRTFRAEQPQVELLLGAMHSLAQLEGLLARRIDAAFLNGVASDKPVIESYEVQAGSMRLALPGGHRLSAAGELRLRDLQDEPLILVSRAYNPWVYDELRANFRSAGLTPRVVQEVDGGSPAVLNLVAAGMGLAIVHLTRVPAGVTLKPLADLTVSYRLHLAWRRDNCSPALAQFVGTTLRLAQHGDRLAEPSAGAVIVNNFL
jgi:DNA-binding transcriptional LysR family regulator